MATFGNIAARSREFRYHDARARDDPCVWLPMGLRTLRPASRLGVGLAVPSYDAAPYPNGSPARARRIAQVVLFFGAPFAIIKSVEYAALHTAMHAAIHTAIHLTIHTALNLSE
jgi:hypothetical protein